MRTHIYNQVEAIISKYKTLASNDEAVQRTLNSISEHHIPEDVDRVMFVDQLIGHIYHLLVGNAANQKVLEEYADATSYYINGLLQVEEEKFLLENFDVFIDYAFSHRDRVPCVNLDDNFDNPYEWSELASFLLKNRSGKFFIAHSYNGKEFANLKNCNITVCKGFVDASIRALACGHTIEEYKGEFNSDSLFLDISNGTYDAAIVDIHCGCDETRDFTTEKCFKAINRIVKEGGEILLCISKKAILSDESTFIRNYLASEHTLDSIIQLPSGDLLLHFVKTAHDFFYVCDATILSKSSDKRIVDMDAFKKEMENGKSSISNGTPISGRYSYELLNEEIILPSYYLSFPNNGTPIREMASECCTTVLSDECNSSERVVTVNQLSQVFSKGSLKIEKLPLLNTLRLRRYYRVVGPVIVIAVSNKDIAIGYMSETSSVLVPNNLYVIKPNKGVDVKYLAGSLLSQTTKHQLTALVYGKGFSARLMDSWSKFVRIEHLDCEGQQHFIQECIMKDYAMQDADMANKDKAHIHAIRLRKHALSQCISAFDSLFNSMESCLKENKGHLFVKDQLSPLSPMTVGEAVAILHSNLKTIREQVAHLTEDNDWGACEYIEPQDFIETYEKKHAEAGFRFVHVWEEYESNSFKEDVYDKTTGKLIFQKGESMNAAWFPSKALQQVLDNIVSNAREHGFRDKNRCDYKICTSWLTDGLNMIIRISNNGVPIIADVNTDLILTYGYSSVLNQNGHSGIGGGEIAEIMHRFGGDVKIISTPDKHFTVTYELKLPLASIY